MAHAVENDIKCAADLPYFEGDFWPYALEELIQELKQDEKNICKNCTARLKTGEEDIEMKTSTPVPIFILISKTIVNSCQINCPAFLIIYITI